MLNSAYSEEYPSDLPEGYQYLDYYDENNYERIVAISKLDENNLKKIASDLKIDYIQMSKMSNIDYKLSDIKRQSSMSQSEEDKISSYQDIYYFFAVPLVILLIVDFVLKKRRM